MFDPRLPSDLAAYAAQKFPENHEEVDNVHTVLSKLPSSGEGKGTGLEDSLEQLGQAKQDLLSIADQMNTFHQSYQAMQTWQAHIEDACRDVPPKDQGP